MSYANMEEEIDGEIIVLGRNDGGGGWKWFGDTVNPMKIDKQIIPTMEERMETLDELVRHNFINEGQYKLKTDNLQKLWRKCNEEEEDSDEDSDGVAVEEMLMNGETVFLDEENGNVYDMEANGVIGIATRLNRNTWSIFNSRNSGRSPELLTYNY